jgi:predicted nucleic acid-binding protein
VLTLVPVQAAVVRSLEAVPRDQIPDMPDRIIAATALALVTRDHRIRSAAVVTIW